MKMPGNSGVLVRELLGYGRSKHRAGLVHHHLMLLSFNSIQRQAFKTLTLNLTSIPTTPSSSPHTFLSTSIHSLSLENFRQQRRLFSSSSSSGPSNVILLDMYHDFYFQLNTVDEESLSAVFYFTTDDKSESNNFVIPILIGLGEQFPHVRIYKMFTEEGQSTLGPFDVSAAPIFFFLRKGVKVAEIVGVDIARLKETFGKLYSQEESQDGGAARDMKCSSGRSKRAATRARKDDKDSSRIALIKSNAQFHKLLRKVKVESLPAVFFFSTAYDDSCARIAPSVRELSERFPHVTVNKIGLKEVDSSVRKFNVRYLPTFIFFQNGKKVCEIIGAEVAQLKDRFTKYYSHDSGDLDDKDKKGKELLLAG
ncbi:hypothetical protein D8674_015025 [Pyrus ussuriensis x Pyrus communis]|uniref:Thioredoxin domain-containing protein n=1 Tax=Pyrus ussuriensis x Pyrus communis TaxID=2448454 RepID=A0A5N5GU59_9ROSA|nr:hypothetical protein D8674_015025 [Pyrus ussuriensis x Pyrus communis]